MLSIPVIHHVLSFDFLNVSILFKKSFNSYIRNFFNSLTGLRGAIFEVGFCKLYCFFNTKLCCCLIIRFLIRKEDFNIKRGGEFMSFLKGLK